jgi:hypothetical protein
MKKVLFIVPIILVLLLVGVMAVGNTSSTATTNQTIVGNSTGSTATTNQTIVGNNTSSTPIYCEDNENEPNCICRVGIKRMIFEEPPCKIDNNTQMEICSQGVKVYYTCIDIRPEGIMTYGGGKNTKLNKGDTINIIIDENLTIANDTLNKSTKATLSNGRNAEIKVMPSSASATAIARLGELNFTIELKEAGKGENTKLNYELKAEKKTKIIGLINKKMEVSATVNAETGEVSIKKPWWAFLAVEEKQATPNADKNVETGNSSGLN